MVDALVRDCNSHLDQLESKRQALETAVANGENDESLREKTSVLAKCLGDYKDAAKHCKKHATAPKAKAKSSAAPAGPAA